MAFLLNFFVNTKSQIIDPSMSIRSINANRGACNPKKRQLQMELRIRFIPKKMIILCLVFSFFAAIHEKYAERAMRKKRIFQTTGKTQFGGVIAGFTELYQEESADDPLKKTPINAAR